MKHFKRNNFIIAVTLIVCMVLCMLWATVFFVRRAKEAAESSADISSESAESSQEETVPPDATDALLKCNERVMHASSFSSTTSGYCDTQVMFFNYRHELISQRFVNGNEIYTADLGLGTHIRYGISSYFNDGVYLVRVGDVASSKEIYWRNTPFSLTQKAYESTFGQVHRSLSAYRITKDTIHSARLKTYSDETYTFVYELDPINASAQYAKRLQLFGALDTLPEFDSIKMTVVMDHEFYPISVSYEETYSVLLSPIGKSTCKAEYTEEFSSFGESVEIPDREHFAQHISMIAVDTCPTLSSGYQLLLSLFEDKSVYDLGVYLTDFEFFGEISADTSKGALMINSEMFDFLYQNDRYHLSYQDFHVYTEAKALNDQFLPLFSGEFSQGRAKNDDTSDFLAGAEIKTEDGILYISSADEGQNFLFEIDTASMTLRKAELSFDLSGFGGKLELLKTDRVAAAPNEAEYEDITESVSAVSFITALFSGEDLRYTLQTNGIVNYLADIVVSTDNGLSFSAFSSTEHLPVDLYFSDQELHAVLGDVSICGGLNDYASILAALSGDSVSLAAESKTTRWVSLSHAQGRVTLGFDGNSKFSVTLTSDSLAFNYDGMDITLRYRGVSNRPPQKAPSITETLSAASLGEFLNGSFIPRLIGAESIGAQLVLDTNAQVIRGDLSIDLSSDRKAQFDTNLNGLDASVILDDSALYLCTPILDAFVELSSVPSVIQRLSSFTNQTHILFAETRVSNDLSVSCDGVELTIDYNGTRFLLKKDAIEVYSQEISLYADNVMPTDAAPTIVHPNRSDCIDLELLSRRLAPVSEQRTFSFSGTVSGKNLSLSILRLDLCLNDAREISSAAIDLLTNNSDVHHIIFNEDALFFDNNEAKLFCLAEPLFAYFSGYDSAKTTIRASGTNNLDMRSIRSVTYRNDILRIETDSACLEINLTKDGITSVDLTFKGVKVSLQSKAFSDIFTPKPDGYIDITPLLTLLPKIDNTYDAGNFDFEGMFDLEVLTMRLKGIALNGTLDFSDDSLKAYVCVDVPYFYGLTSGDISLKNGNSLLRSCKIKSEIFVLADRIYLCRTIHVSYGYTQPERKILIEKKYMTFEDFLCAPEQMLAFVLNLAPELELDASKSLRIQSTDHSSASGTLKNFYKRDEEYILEFNPDKFSSTVDNLTVYAEADETYVTRLGVESTISNLTIDLFGVLTNHGNTKFEFKKDDFTAYVPLQD